MTGVALRTAARPSCAMSNSSTRQCVAMPSAAVDGMMPIRDSARASAASTSSIACTQARSDAVGSITSVLRLGPQSAADGKEGGLPFALQSDVEVQHAIAMLRDEALPACAL